MSACGPGQEVIDVLGIGAVSVDFFGTTEGWPDPGGKQRLKSFSVEDGGLIGTALVAVARLGGRASFAGKLGFSEMAERAVGRLEQEGVDTSTLVRSYGAEPAVSVVISDVKAGQRTIFSSLQGVEFPRTSDLPDSLWSLDRTKVLLFDHVSGWAGIEVAKRARSVGIPVVIDAERTLEHIGAALAVSDHIVVPEGFAFAYTGREDLREAVVRLKRAEHQAVVVTRGADGCFGFSSEGFFQIPAFPVDPVDTTGCGDVFHGAYALSLAQSRSVVEAARFASAVAALSTRKLGGRRGIPNLEEVLCLLRS
jgi:sugar/nucleoside kinase (ribokinase family)